MASEQEERTERTTNSQSVTRRSVRSSSEVRHGRVYEDPNETIMRTVTPDSAASATNFPLPLSEQSTLSPTTLTNPFQGQAPTSARDTSTSLSNTDEDSTIDSNKSTKPLKKAKTRDEMSTDASPNSMKVKARKRLGSVASASPGAGRADDNSIGFPSVVNALPFPNLQSLGKVQEQTPRTPRRKTSADNTMVMGPGSAKSPLFLSTDSNKILHLMKTTCGRMTGILFFRAIGNSGPAWQSGYCAINVAPGSLVCQAKGEVAHNKTKTLVPDLRGCTVRTHFDAESNTTFISIVLPSSGNGIQLRPPVPETFDSWLAALLCWQPLRPKGIHNRMSKPQPVMIALERRPPGSRRLSDVASSKSKAIVKVGRMLLWDGPLPAGSQRNISKQPADLENLPDDSPWRRVSCTLHENGTFKLLTDGEAKTICSIKLAQLSRCAIQRLDDSVLETPFCVSIYPQYTVHTSNARRFKPIVLGLESQAAFEAWFVLLRALTVPELYGPEQSMKEMEANGHASHEEDKKSHKHAILDTTNMFRIERNLSIKVTEVKLDRDLVSGIVQGPQTSSTSLPDVGQLDVYADVLFGRDLRARTTTKTCSTSALWAEEFVIPDIPSTLSAIRVSVKVGNPAEKEWTMVAHEAYDLSSEGSQLPGFNGIEVNSHDPDFGKIDIQLDGLEQERSIDKWWELTDHNGSLVGSILLKIYLSETVVLMEEEYLDIAKLLRKFDNSLTSQLGQVLSQDLKPLSDTLLDIYQASDVVHEWIATLIEEEIDGIYKEAPPVRMRFTGRTHSHDSYESAEQREILVRDLSRSATMEANLLFRGNSLVTKSLDSYMRRMGKDYLEETLGDKLRSIIANPLDCEVDPMKVRKEQLKENWINLINVTNSVWRVIAVSASQCPTGMRMIFKHIRSCAEDRYGAFIRTVRFTSVSGFLFLRFFCPAVLNPQLFGLIEELPSERARRTFTLVAKALNVLASMAKFGTKEPWMEPMNKSFLNSATPSFKNFIEDICSVSLSESPTPLEPQFLAPNQIRNRLSQTSKEGLPTLPYLIDAPRCIASLVDLWMENAPTNMAELSSDYALSSFHNMAVKLHTKAKDCVSSAELADKPDTSLEPQWQQIISEQAQHRQEIQRNFSPGPFEDQFSIISEDQEITALPQRTDSLRTNSSTAKKSISSRYDGYGVYATPVEANRAAAAATLEAGANSAGSGYERDTEQAATLTQSNSRSERNRRPEYSTQTSTERDIPTMTNSTNSSTVSFDMASEGDRYANAIPTTMSRGSSSRDGRGSRGEGGSSAGSKSSRFFDLMSGGRKSRQRDVD